ncbi:MAG: histidine kinase [bacterium]
MSPRLMAWVRGGALWTLLAVLSASEAVLAASLDGRPYVTRVLVIRTLLSWYSCALMTPALFALARRWPARAPNIATHGAIQAVACVVLAIVKYALESAIGSVVLGNDARDFRSLMQYGYISEVIILWGASAIIHAILSASQLRERELHAVRLSASLSSARLEAITARLQPHFLFNTLQGISTLLHRDPHGADRVLGHLSMLLRGTLQMSARPEIPLAEELALLEEFIAIAETRFGDRLTVVRSVPDEVRRARVPALVLQPLVENALDHGVARKSGASVITIAATRDGGRLRLMVSDDGAGLSPERREGIGLGTTRARLDAMYGADAAMAISPRGDGGTIVELMLPWRTEGPAGTPEVA